MESLSIGAKSTCDHLAVSAGRTASCLTSSTIWKVLSVYNRDEFYRNPIFNLEITHDRDVQKHEECIAHSILKTCTDVS